MACIKSATCPFKSDGSAWKTSVPSASGAKTPSRNRTCQCGFRRKSLDTRYALHHADRAALATDDAVLGERALVEPEHGVDEYATHAPRELAVEGQPRPKLERKCQHELAQRHTSRDHVVHQVGGALRHAPAQARWTKSAPTA
jgi:hypothetical protein